MTRWAWIIGVTASVLLACEADTSDGSPEPTDGGSDAAQTDTGDGDVIADGTDPGDIACPTLDLECAGGEAPIDTNGDGCPDECPSAPDDVVSVPDVVADTAGDGSSSGDADIAEDAAQPCPDMAECPRINVSDQKWPDVPANMYIGIFEDEKNDAHT